MKKLRCVYFGAPAFLMPFFDALQESRQIEVVGVVTKPDKPIGRKQEVVSSALKLRAEKHGIPVLTPSRLKNEEFVSELKELNADVFVVIAYGKIIPKVILDIPRLRCVNMHPSLLPKYRGPSPIKGPILYGDEETGISIMLLDEGMDTGPLLAQKSFPIDEAETFESLTQKIESIGPEFLIETLNLYESGIISPTKQDEKGVSVTPLLTREDGRIDWSNSALNIERKIRALYPWPGTFTIWKTDKEERRVKIIKSALAKNHDEISFGMIEIDDKKIFVGAKDGVLEILELQLEGKSKMNAKEFIRGYGPQINGSTFV